MHDIASQPASRPSHLQCFFFFFLKAYHRLLSCGDEWQRNLKLDWNMLRVGIWGGWEGVGRRQSMPANWYAGTMWYGHFIPWSPGSGRRQIPQRDNFLTPELAPAWHCDKCSRDWESVAWGCWSLAMDAVLTSVSWTSGMGFWLHQSICNCLTSAVRRYQLNNC